MLKATGVPQLWCATGDFSRDIDGIGSRNDPFAKSRSRMTHRSDLNSMRDKLRGVVDANQVRELVARKFDGLKIDGDAVGRLVALDGEGGEGGVRLVENVLKHARRAVKAGKLDRVDARIIGQCIDRSLSVGTKRRMITRAAAGTCQTMPATPLPSAPPAARSKVG